MPAGKIICVRCRKPRRSSPCDACRRLARPDLADHGERVRRQQAIDLHVMAHGLRCPGWGDRKPHLVSSRRELSADHPQSVAAGGNPSPDEYDVLCIPCNSAKGARQH